MWDNIQLIWAVWDFMSSPQGAAIFAALFGLSEALGAIPAIRANGVFQAAYDFLKKMANK
jgi:hypothetical protein